MIDRCTGAIQRIHPVRENGWIAALRLAAAFLIGFMIVLLPATANAVPAGTAISNTAQISYTFNGTPGYTANSNTHTFLVESLAAATSATQTLTGPATTVTVYAGTTAPLTIDLTNTSNTTLINGQLKITAPVNTRINLTGAGATALSTSSTATTTTRTFIIADLALGASNSYQATLTLPLQLDPANNTVIVDYIANGSTINNQNLKLNLSSRSRSTVEFLTYAYNRPGSQVLAVGATAYDQGNSTFASITAPTLPDNPAVTVTSAPLSVEAGSAFSHGQPVILRTEDRDHNINSAVKDTLDVTLTTNSGDTETLRLTETDVNSGVFAGYIVLKAQAATAHNGTLDIGSNTEITARYTDSVDTSDTTTATAIVDPYGKIIDSATGAPLDGYTIEMINTDTGQPATVYGDDGVSLYPATVISGGSVTDASLKTYTFGPGEYRFPFAPVGNYRLKVTPPAGAAYHWPSTKQPDSLLTNLPGGPYAITLGSRGETFPLLAGPPLHIDIPVDPLNSQLWIQRSANAATAAPGDFIQFKVEVENVTNFAIGNVMLADELPHGFRLEKGSVTINGISASDPAIDTDGTTLNFNLGNIAASTKYTIEYVAAVGAVHRGLVTSRSHATGNSGAATSNTAELNTTITEELMHSRALLLGRVIIDGSNGIGLPSARVYMEDGRYALTDERGMFHFEDVTPGTHVVQLDLDTIPPQYDVVAAEQNTRFAGSAWSQFIDVKGGTLWRTDFHVAERQPVSGNVKIQISNEQPDEDHKVYYRINLSGEGVPVDNLRLNIMLPEGAEYLPDTATMNGRTLSEPRVAEGLLTFKLGDRPANWEQTLRLALSLRGLATAEDYAVTRAYLLFNTPAKQNQRSSVAQHTLPVKGVGVREIVEELIVNSKFPTGSATLSKSGRDALDDILPRLKKSAAAFIFMSSVIPTTLHPVGSTENCIEPTINCRNYALNR